MEKAAFLGTIGLLFVALGRWIYRNPAKVYPSWVPSTPNGQFSSKFVRAFAIVVIFIGTYCAIAGIGTLWLTAWVAAIIALLAGLAAAWFLRPKV